MKDLNKILTPFHYFNDNPFPERKCLNCLQNIHKHKKCFNYIYKAYCNNDYIYYINRATMQNISFHTLNECKNAFDEILIKEGYELLTDEDYKKYQILL